MRTLLVLSALAIGLPLNAVADGSGGGEAALANFYRQVQTLKAHFHQVQRDSNGSVMQTVDGTFYLARPKRFRWVYKKPYHQIILSNGKVFKFYDVGLKQVTIRSIGASLKATPARLLSGGTGLKKAFKIEDVPNKNGVEWLALTPRSNNAQFDKIELGLKNNRPEVLRLHDKLGQTTRIKFSDIELNPDIAKKHFKLDVPSDVAVVDAREKNSGVPTAGSGKQPSATP
ncbi:outer membrane lipoprotein chaperone LolA [Salinisphaera orenii]|uniref:outer membrane lipoprotein chaperone LolA n=1 Tax=Salinisphaera orenii TaxID=856731 RepID=UPI0013A63076